MSRHKQHHKQNVVRKEPVIGNMPMVPYGAKEPDMSKCICPIVYINQDILRIPTPFDPLIKNMLNEVDAYRMSLKYRKIPPEEEDTEKAYMNFLIKRIIDALAKEYMNCITGTVESYIEETLVPKFKMTSTGGDAMTNCVIKDFIADIGYRVEYGQITRFTSTISTWWSNYNTYGKTDIAEERNYRRMLEDRDQIGIAIADRLCNLARQISFGEPTIASENTIPEYMRDIILDDVSRDLDGESVNAQEFYGMQLAEYMYIIDGVMPYVEIVLNNLYETFKAIYFDENLLFIGK